MKKIFSLQETKQKIENLKNKKFQGFSLKNKYLNTSTNNKKNYLEAISSNFLKTNKNSKKTKLEYFCENKLNNKISTNEPIPIKKVVKSVIKKIHLSYSSPKIFPKKIIEKFNYKNIYFTIKLEESKANSFNLSKKEEAYLINKIYAKNKKVFSFMPKNLVNVNINKKNTKRIIRKHNDPPKQILNENVKEPVKIKNNYISNTKKPLPNTELNNPDAFYKNFSRNIKPQKEVKKGGMSIEISTDKTGIQKQKRIFMSTFNNQVVEEKKEGLMTFSINNKTGTKKAKRTFGGILKHNKLGELNNLF